MAHRNVGRLTRDRIKLTLDSESSEPAGLTEFRKLLSLVEQHLQGPRGHLMPTLSVSKEGDEVVGFRFIRDRRLYLANVLPYREQRVGYPRYEGEPSRTNPDAVPELTERVPERQRSRRGSGRG